MNDDERTALVLEDVGPNKIQVIKIVRELTHLGLADTKNLVERAPCELGHFPDAVAARFTYELTAAGARVGRADGRDAVDPRPAHGAHPASATVILEASGPNKIQVIKAVRVATNLGLKEAKDLVDGTPCQVGPMAPEVMARFLADVAEAGAHARPADASVILPAVPPRPVRNQSPLPGLLIAIVGVADLAYGLAVLVLGNPAPLALPVALPHLFFGAVLMAIGQIIRKSTTAEPGA